MCHRMDEISFLCAGDPREAYVSHAPTVDMAIDEQDGAYEKADQDTGQQEQKHRAHRDIETGDQQKECIAEAQRFPCELTEQQGQEPRQQWKQCSPDRKPARKHSG